MNQKKITEKKYIELSNNLGMLFSDSEKKISTFTKNKKQYPVIFIFGAPRSGTTYTLPLLQKSGITVPSNLLARHYKVPLTGLFLSQIINSFHSDFSQNFISKCGKTEHMLDVNEFYFFWRLFFKKNVDQNIDIKDIESLFKGEDFKNMSDSRAGISCEPHIKYKHIINEYIIFVQGYNDSTGTITLKGYKFLSKNAYFDTYIQNQYDSGNKKGGTCNFIPYSYDWFMSGPITIMDVDINISTIEPEITYHLYNPLSEIYDTLPIAMLEKKLTSGEKTIILDKTKLINGCFEYDYIKDIFKIRSKSIGKPRGITSRK